MDKDKTSTDPQENEIDSNILGGAFRKMFGNGDDAADEKGEKIEAENQTIDEQQDPANK
jgi:hypothetical protein